MKKLSKRAKALRNKQIKVNAWAVLGYTASIMSYALLAMSVFGNLLSSSVVTGYQSAPATPPLSGDASAVSTVESVLATVFSYGVTIVMLVIAAVMLVTFPYLLSKYYARLLRRGLNMMRMKATLRNLYYLKAIAAVLPLVGFMVMAFVDPYFTSTFGYFYIASVVFVVLALGLFLVQLLVIHRTKLATAQIW